MGEDEEEELPEHTFDSTRCLPLTFWLPDDGAERTLIFSQSPFGIDFSMGNPPAVRGVKADSPAHGMGVSPGWILSKINDQDVTGLTFKDVYLMIKKHSSELPKLFPISINGYPQDRLAI